MNEITDNLEEIMAEIAAVVKTINVDGAKSNVYSPHSITLQKHNTECYINIREHSRSISELITDDNGNDFMPIDLWGHVNYPSHIADDIETVTNHAQFILDCCQEARKIEERFADRKIYSLWRSAESKKECEKNKKIKMVKEFVEDNCKGMRVGNVRELRVSSEIPNGCYEIIIKDKYYKTIISTIGEYNTVQITRLSPIKDNSMVAGMDEIPK
jgi:hypothetical protein